MAVVFFCASWKSLAEFLDQLQKLRFLMDFLLWKMGYQFFRFIFHPPPEPDLDPAVQEESDIGGGIGGGHLLLRIETAQIQDDVFEQIDQPSFI